MRSVIYTLLCCMAPVLAGAQPHIQWQHSYGTTGDDMGNSVKQTPDGGYLVAGYSGAANMDASHNNGLYDYWVVKLSPTGAVAWERSFGGSNYDLAYSLALTSDGGCVVAGKSGSNDSNVTGHHGAVGVIRNDFWVVKLSATGALQWQKSLGGSGDDIAYTITQTYEGGYIVAGSSTSADGDVTVHHGSIQPDSWVVKLNDTGGITWQKTFGGVQYDAANAVEQMPDSGFVVVGSTRSTDGDVVGNHTTTATADIWVLRLDKTGNIIWQKCIGGTDDEDANAIHRTLDGGFIVSGLSKSTDGDLTTNNGLYDALLVKLSATGSIQWQRAIGGAENDYALDVVQTSDSGYVAGGLTLSHEGDVTGNHGVRNAWVYKTTKTGSLLWEKCLGGSDHEEANAMARTTDGGFIFAGNSTSVNGDVTANHGGSDMWVVKFYDSTMASLGAPALAAATGVGVWPNPATTLLHIYGAPAAGVKLYNCMGQVLAVPENGDTIDMSGCVPGIYLVRVYGADGQLRGCTRVLKE